MEGEGEVGEGREDHERVVHAPLQDLPAPLMPDDVVDLLAVVGAVGDDVGHALGEREGLVDEGALGGGKELTRELRHGRDVSAIGDDHEPRAGDASLDLLRQWRA